MIPCLLITRPRFRFIYFLFLFLAASDFVPLPEGDLFNKCFYCTCNLTPSARMIYTGRSETTARKRKKINIHTKCDAITRTNKSNHMMIEWCLFYNKKKKSGKKRTMLKTFKANKTKKKCVGTGGSFQKNFTETENPINSHTPLCDASIIQRPGVTKYYTSSKVLVQACYYKLV